MATATLARTGRRQYTEWLRAVSRYIALRLAVTLDDLPDIDCRGYYDDDLSPAEAARDILSELADREGLDLDIDD